MLSLLALASVSADQLGDGFAHFSRHPALVRDHAHVAVGVLERDRQSGQTIYWACRTTETREGKSVTWTDSRACPALRGVLLDMRQLPRPVIAVPGMEDAPLPLTLDGVDYRLSTTAHYASGGVELSFNSNVGSPLAAWVEASLRSLDRCWTATVPVRT